ncbi:hypothetical protein ACFLXV_00825 [Chloroflexota bacterium]
MEAALKARIELIPKLEHCIETTARQEFSKSKDEYLQGGVENKELEARIELLRMFLYTVDFKELRRESEKLLIAGKTVRFVLYLGEGKLRHEMRVEN